MIDGEKDINEELAAAWGEELLPDILDEGDVEPTKEERSSPPSTVERSNPDLPEILLEKKEGKKRVLSQDEIDSLLGFDSPKESSNDSTIATILNSNMVYYERLPMLEVVFDRMVRLLSTSLRNFTSDNVEVNFDSLISLRFGDYLNSIPLPAMIGVFTAKEWENQGLITIDSSLIYSVIDVLMGGRKGTAPIRIEGRPYTSIERKLIERMMKLVLIDMSNAFNPLTNIGFSFDRLETNPKFATIVRPANTAVLVKLQVDMDDRGGMLEVLLPYATIEPIRDILLQNFMGEKFGQDNIWETHLAEQIWNTDLELSAILDQVTIKLRDVLGWEEGSQLKLNATNDSPIYLQCNHHTMLKGYMARKGEFLAIRVEDNILLKEMK